jgi:putative transposase
MIKRSYQYRLYPNKAQTEALLRILEIHRQLYNAALQERREAWRKCRVSISYIDQANQIKELRTFDEDAAWLNYTSIQQTLRRLDKAFCAFFRRSRMGEKPGYPRFKNRKRFRSVEYRFGDGAALRNGRLRVQNVGLVKIKLHRPIPPDAKIKAAVITRRGDGKWYATFQLKLPNPSPDPHSGMAVGIDLGVNPSLVALSNGETIDAPRFLRRSETRLAKAQRITSRRCKGSQRWHKGNRQVAQLHRHIANQRRDQAHKLSRRLTDTFSFIAVENLNITGMIKNHCLAKSISDAGWSQLLQFLAYKAESAGSQVVAVDPYNTSQVCSACGRLVPKDLSVRWHDCSHCGLSLDRDVNAARNILNKALARTGPSVVASLVT